MFFASWVCVCSHKKNEPASILLCLSASVLPSSFISDRLCGVGPGKLGLAQSALPRSEACTHTHAHIRTHKHDLSSNQIETFVNATTAKLLILVRERRSSDEANHVWLSAKEATARLLTRLTSSHRQGEGAAFCGRGFFPPNLAIMGTRQNNLQDLCGDGWSWSRHHSLSSVEFSSVYV